MGTTPRGIWFPEDYNDPADVPTVLEANAQTIDAALGVMDGSVVGALAAMAAAIPTGAIIAFGGSAAPAGWALCNGAPHGSPALAAVLGSANTPDLRDRFVVGAGPGTPAGSTGGADAVALTAAQTPLPVHSHGASAGNTSVDHTHAVNPPAANTGGESADHSHGAGSLATGAAGSHSHGGYANNWLEQISPAGTGRWVLGQEPKTDANMAAAGSHQHPMSGATGGRSAGHTHSVDIPQFNSAGQSATHTHAVTVADSPAPGAAQAHENRPPFWALTYIIRTGV